MKKNFAGIIMFVMITAAVLAYGTVTYAKETETKADTENKSQEAGKTFLDMIIEEPEEGEWKDVKEVTPEVLGDGIFQVDMILSEAGGEGTIMSPVTVNISGGAAKALIIWDDDRYEYMSVNGVEYLPLGKEDTSVFEIDIEVLNKELDAAAGGTNEDGSVWEEYYVLSFDLDTLEKDGMNPRTFGMIFGVVIGIVVMFGIIKLDKLHDKKKAAAQSANVVKNTNKYRK